MFTYQAAMVTLTISLVHSVELFDIWRELMSERLYMIRFPFFDCVICLFVLEFYFCNSFMLQVLNVTVKLIAAVETLRPFVVLLFVCIFYT